MQKLSFFGKIHTKIVLFSGTCVRSRRYLNMVAISDRNDAGFCLNTVEIEFIDEDDLPLANVFEHRV